VRTDVEVAMSIASSVFVQSWIMTYVGKARLYLAESNDVKWVLKEAAAIRRSDEASNGIDVEAANVELVPIVKECGALCTLSHSVRLQIIRFALMKCREL
jgi:hypothetical protein